MDRKLATNLNGLTIQASALKRGIQADVADQQLRACGPRPFPAEDSLTIEVPVAVSTEWMAWWLYFCFE
jgi:hypothetical protein